MIHLLSLIWRGLDTMAKILSSRSIHDIPIATVAMTTLMTQIQHHSNLCLEILPPASISIYFSSHPLLVVEDDAWAVDQIYDNMKTTLYTAINHLYNYFTFIIANVNHCIGKVVHTTGKIHRPWFTNKHRMLMLWEMCVIVRSQVTVL